MITKSYIYSVRFDEGSADIPEGELAGVDQGIARWPGMPDHRVRVTGNADAKREEEGLALTRAKAVFRYLVDHGVDAARIDALTTYTDIANHWVMVEFYNPHTSTPS